MNSCLHDTLFNLTFEEIAGFETVTDALKITDLWNFHFILPGINTSIHKFKANYLALLFN